MTKIVKKGKYQGTSLADSYEIVADEVTLRAGTGNDTITVTGGKKSKVYAEAGDDVIVVEKGSATKLHSGSGNDAIAVLATAKKVYGGAGHDEIFVEPKGSVSRLDAGTGNDRITVTGGYYERQVTTLLAGKGNDTISLLEGGSVKSALGGAGKDEFIVKGHNGFVGAIQLNGGTGNDKFDFNGVGSDANVSYSTFNVVGGAGNNMLSVVDTTANLNYVGNKGIDIIYLSNGKINGKMMGGSNHDVFHLENLNIETENYSVALYGEKGDDSFSINSSIVDVVDTGSGSDIVNMDSSYIDDMVMGTGSDALIMKGGSIAGNFDTGSGNDVVILENGGFSTGYLGAGDDVIHFTISRDTVRNLNENIDDYSFNLYAGSGNDSIYGKVDTKYDVKNNRTHWISLEKGNDTIELRESSFVSIDTGSGINNLKFDEYLSNSAIYADKSLKNEMIADALYHVQYFGSERGIDVVSVKEATSSYVNLDNGNDVFTMEESYGGNTVDAGNGNDIIFVASQIHIHDSSVKVDTYYAGDGNDTYHLGNIANYNNRMVELYGGDGKDIYDVSGFADGVVIKDYEEGDVIRINTDLVSLPDGKPTMYIGEEYGVGSFDGRLDCGVTIAHAQLMPVMVETYNRTGVTGQYVLEGKYV